MACHMQAGDPGTPVMQSSLSSKSQSEKSVMCIYPGVREEDIKMRCPTLSIKEQTSPSLASDLFMPSADGVMTTHIEREIY